MPYQNDMSTLADVVGGASAATQAGIQNDLANQQQQMANSVYQQQMPALAQEAGLKNLYTQAQTANTQGMAAQNLAKGQVDLATSGSQIDKTNAVNKTQMTAAQAQSLGQVGQIAGQLAGAMDNVPQAARPAAMAQLSQQYGVPMQALQSMGLDSGDPDALRQFSQKSIQASADYQSQYMKEQMGNQGKLAVAQQEGADRLASTQALVAGRNEVADKQAAAKQRNLTVNQVIGQLTAKVAAGTATDQDRAALKYANDTLQMQRSGNPFAAQLTGTDVQSNTPQVPASPGSGAPAAPAAPPTQNAVEAEMRRRGLLK